MAGAMSATELTRQLGPFALVKKPDAKAEAPQPIGHVKTAVISRAQISSGALGLLFQFNDLAVATLPPMDSDNEMTVGRAPSCDLVLSHDSVSNQHAVIKWNPGLQTCSVVDLKSTNGTYLNAATRVESETIVRDGDILSFGDEQFWFLLTPTLHARLADHSKNPSLPHGV